MDIKKIILIFAVLLVIIAAIPLSQMIFRNGLPFGEKRINVTIDGHTFSAVVAETEEKKQIGLSSRKSISEKDGMLFNFDNADYYSFWMKNMQFPIDIIFLKDNKVVAIHKNVQPPSDDQTDLPLYQPDEPADAVLEIKAGLADEYGIEEGDEVKIDKS